MPCAAAEAGATSSPLSWAMVRTVRPGSGFKRSAAPGPKILAVACPNCAKMLDDAAKTEGLEETLRVMDLAEIAGLAG